MKCKILLTILLFILFLAISPGCKKKTAQLEVSDIRGTWEITVDHAGIPVAGQIVFNGSLNAGTVQNGNFSGTYTVNKTRVDFTIEVLGTNNDGLASFGGGFTTTGQIAGSCNFLIYDTNLIVSGAWAAVR